MKVRLIRSLVYAGIISNALAMLVSAFSADWAALMWGSVGLSIWTFDYLYYKMNGLW